MQALLGAAVLFRANLLLARRLSINVIKHLEETVSGFLSGSFEIEQVRPIALTNESLATLMMRRKILNKNVMKMEKRG